MLVAVGGGIGSVARFWIAVVAANHVQGGRFPLGTFIANLAGCLIIGMLWALGERWSFFSPPLRLLLFTGLIGGFTTFSSFGLETVLLLRNGDIAMASLYVVLSLAGGLSVLWLAIWMVRP